MNIVDVVREYDLWFILFYVFVWSICITNINFYVYIGIILLWALV
jgi:hypothetical protein